MATTKKTKITSVRKDTEKLELFYTVDRTIKWCRTLETVGKFLKMLSIRSLYNPAILVLDIYPREMRTHVHTIHNKPVETT